METTAVERERSTPYLWRFTNVEFDERSFELRVGGVSVDVERAPLRVLRELLETPRELVSREELLASVWKRKPETISRNALTNAISKLRRAIGDDDQTLVVSAAGEGYLLDTDVERRPLPSLQLLNQILKAGQAVPHRANWMLHERIGATGSSEVWKVVHAKTHELRVLKFAGDSFQLAALRREVTISRLLTEALGARPEFARIHDWNLDQPPLFIESEYAGEDLSQWAINHGGLDQIPLTERLAVIVELADAVALAHSVGALHKDLKPGNVAIHQDASGTRVRILDFGSGRLLDQDILDQFQITRMVLPEADPNSGTPFYIAPELLSGAPPTIASDIYALGILLYQFLVGDLQKSIAPGWEAEIDDPLLREDVALAANSNAALRPTAAEFANRLRSLAARHARREEEERQREAARLAALAIERFRARRGVIMVAMVMLTIALAISLGLYANARNARLRAEAERQRAEQAAAEAEASSKFLTTDVFNDIGAEQKMDTRGFLDSIDRDIDRRLGAQPMLAAKTRMRLADTYEGLGDLRASRHLDDELWQQIRTAVDAQADEALPLALAWAKTGGGRVYANGPRYWATLHQAAIKRYGADSPEAATLQMRLGCSDFELGDYAGARREETAAVDTLRRVRPDHLDNVWALNRLAMVEMAVGDFAATEQHLRQSLATAHRVDPDRTRPTLFPRSLLGEIETMTGRYADAELDLGSALDELRKIRASSNTLLNMTLLRTSLLRLRQGRLDEAQVLLTEARHNLESGFGTDDLDVLARVAPYEMAYDITRHDTAAATSLLQRTTLAYAAHYPDELPDVSLLKISLAGFLASGETAETAKALLDSLGADKRSLLETQPYLHARLNWADGVTAIADGHTDTAIAKLEEALRLLKAQEKTDTALLDAVEGDLVHARSHLYASR